MKLRVKKSVDSVARVTELAKTTHTPYWRFMPVCECIIVFIEYTCMYLLSEMYSPFYVFQFNTPPLTLYVKAPPDLFHSIYFEYDEKFTHG